MIVEGLKGKKLSCALVDSLMYVISLCKVEVLSHLSVFVFVILESNKILECRGKINNLTLELRIHIPAFPWLILS